MIFHLKIIQSINYSQQIQFQAIFKAYPGRSHAVRIRLLQSGLRKMRGFPLLRARSRLITRFICFGSFIGLFIINRSNSFFLLKSIFGQVVELTLYSQQTTLMYPSKRSSVSSNKHHNSVASIDIEPNLENERVERYIEYIKLSLRTHLKEKQYLYEQTELKELHKLIKNIHHHYLKTQKDAETSAKQLEKERAVNGEATAQIQSDLERQIQQLQSEHNQKVLSINNQFGRKEQAYKEIIEKLVNGLSNAQRLQQDTQNKLQIAVKCLHKVADNRRKFQHINQSIKDIVQQIQLRHDNSKISEKSDEMSMDQIVISGQRLGINLIEDSQHFQDAAYTPAEKKIESWLLKLICYGLFQKKNEECIKKMITLTANYDNPAQILKENVFPLISEVLVNNMKSNHDEAARYLDGSSLIDHNESHVELRNINNLSQLSINDSQMEDFNFKKREHF